MRDSIKSAFIKLCQDEEGASAIEYAMIAAMVAIALVSFIEPINTAVTGIFTKIQAALG